MKTEFDYIIIGGGVAGLAALSKLKNKNHTVLLLERDSECGGLVKSQKKDGFLLETGPNAFMKSYTHTMDYINELGLGDEVIGNRPEAGHRFVYNKDKIHPIPEGPISFLLTPLFTLFAKIRLIFEPFIPAGKEKEETVYNFGKRRFGEEVSTTVMDAMVSGVCAGDFRKLDVHSLFPKIGLIERKFKSFLLFLLLFKFKTTKKNDKNEKVTFYSLKNGMGSIAQKAQELFKDSIKLNCEVSNIHQENNGYKIITTQGEFQTKKIVFATPANIASELLKNIAKPLSTKLAQIPYCSIVTSLLTFKKDQVEHPCNGFGYLIPRNQNIRILGGLFSSTLFANRAPEQHTSIKVYIGGAHDPEINSLPKGEIDQIILQEIKPILGISGNPISMHTKKIESAIPQYNIGHRQIKEEIYRELQSLPDLFLAGNYLEGISVNEAINSGNRVN